MREDHAILGVVRKRDALIGTCEDHAVIPGGGAAAQRCKADIARPPCAGNAVAATCGAGVQVDVTAGGGGFAEQ